MPQDDVQAKIAKAKAAGYSDAEIQAYLGKTGPTAISGGHTSSMAPGSFQMHPGGPIETPSDIHSLVTSRSGIGNTLPLGTEPMEARMLAVEAAKQYPEELSKRVSQEPYYDAALSPLALLAGYGTGNPVATAKGLAGSTIGAPIGAALGRYAGGPKFGDVGAGLGGLVGGLYGGYRAIKGGGMPPLSRVPGLIGRAGRVLEYMAGEEPAAASGAAREAAGGTAATAMPGQAAETGAGTVGAQAGPSAGPKNAGELSATVQRVRSGRAPGTAASPIYTPESLASEQGMSTAALGKGGFNLTIPPEQQKIMQMVAEGRVPMGSRPPAQGFEGLGKPTPFTGAAAPTPVPQPIGPEHDPGFRDLVTQARQAQQPPSGTSPTFEPISDIEEAIRGGPGINPALKSVNREMGGDTSKMFDFMQRLAKYKRSLGK